MSTISQIIYRVRTLIKQHTDDSPYSDEFLYGLIKQETSHFLSQKAKKFYHLSDWSYQCFCLGLEETFSHDCECVPLGCTALKTVYKIPKPILARNRPLLYVKTLGEERIPIHPQNYIEINKYDPIKSVKPFATIYNEHLIVWNVEDLKVIIVCSIPEDITQWAEIQYCNNEGEEIEPCYNIEEDPYINEPELESLVIRKVLEVLRIPLSIIEDVTNDTNENIKS